MYNWYPSSSTSNLLVESQRLQQERDGEAADAKRTRHLCDLLYHKQSCDTIIPTCKTCGHQEKKHPVPASKLCCPVGHSLLSGAPNLICMSCNRDGTVKACKECKWGLCTDCVKRLGECRSFVASDLCTCLRPKEVQYHIYTHNAHSHINNSHSHIHIRTFTFTLHSHTNTHTHKTKYTEDGFRRDNGKLVGPSPNRHELLRFVWNASNQCVHTFRPYPRHCR